MNSLITKGVISLICLGVVSALGFATNSLFITIPKLEAKVERIDKMDEKLDKLIEDVSFIKGQYEKH